MTFSLPSPLSLLKLPNCNERFTLKIKLTSTDFFFSGGHVLARHNQDGVSRRGKDLMDIPTTSPLVKLSFY